MFLKVTFSSRGDEIMKPYFGICTPFLLIVVGCSTASKDYTYMQGADYQNRQTLTKGLINDNEKLSEDAVQKILSSKVALPKKVTLAVVRLVDTRDGGLNFQMVDKELEQQFFEKKLWGDRVQSLILVPQIMISHPITLQSLRQAAALLQADALVVIRPLTYSLGKASLFSDNMAKSTTSIEVLVLDTRTNVVPYTSLITEDAEITETSNDYSQMDLLGRAMRVSEKKAMLQVPAAIDKFMSGVL